MQQQPPASRFERFAIWFVILVVAAVFLWDRNEAAGHRSELRFELGQLTRAVQDSGLDSGLGGGQSGNMRGAVAPDRESLGEIRDELADIGSAMSSLRRLESIDGSLESIRILIRGL